MKKTAFLFLGFFITPLVFSIPLEELISPSHAGQLRSGSGIMFESQLRNPSFRLLPDNNELRQFINEAKNRLGPNMLIEALYLYNKPALTGNWTEPQRHALYNQILALSTMTGIQYYSATRGVMRTFFEYSSVVDDPGAKNPLPDPSYPVPPPGGLSLYARQRDLTFGDNIYRYSYFLGADSIYFTQENITALTYGIIQVIGRNNLWTVISIHDCGDSLLIYTASMVKAGSFPGMGSRISSSFSNRAEAVLKWFSGRADMVFPAGN